MSTRSGWGRETDCLQQTATAPTGRCSTRAERAATGRLAALEGGGGALPDEPGAGGSVVLGVGIAERAGGARARPAAARCAARRRGVLARQDGARRRLLLLDVTGRHPRVAVSIGELDTAAHVATFVGGFTTTVRGDLDRHDRDLALCGPAPWAWPGETLPW